MTIALQIQEKIIPAATKGVYLVSRNLVKKEMIVMMGDVVNGVVTDQNPLSFTFDQFTKFDEYNACHCACNCTCGCDGAIIDKLIADGKVADATKVDVSLTGTTV